jgi:hypothetical protein
MEKFSIFKIVMPVNPRDRNRSGTPSVQRRGGISACKVFIGLVLCLLLWGGSSAEDAHEIRDSLDAVERKLELGRHDRLLQMTRVSGGELTEFTTDGCSGGLSAGWSYLVAMLPGARKVHGDLPPWESCCVEHDRLYHSGGFRMASAEGSFEARKGADLELASCVRAMGLERAPQLSQQYNLNEQRVINLYETIAALMYRAVRIGGVPCSGLAWRWGYGWPRCD